MEIFNSTNKKPPIHFDEIGDEVNTIQGQALSIRQTIQRYNSGLIVNQQKTPYYDETSSFESINPLQTSPDPLTTLENLTRTYDTLARSMGDTISAELKGKAKAKAEADEKRLKELESEINRLRNSGEKKEESSETK